MAMGGGVPADAAANLRWYREGECRMPSDYYCRFVVAIGRRIFILTGSKETIIELDPRTFNYVEFRPDLGDRSKLLLYSKGFHAYGENIVTLINHMAGTVLKINVVTLGVDSCTLGTNYYNCSWIGDCIVDDRIYVFSSKMNEVVIMTVDLKTMRRRRVRAKYASLVSGLHIASVVANGTDIYCLNRSTAETHIFNTIEKEWRNVTIHAPKSSKSNFISVNGELILVCLIIDGPTAVVIGRALNFVKQNWRWEPYLFPAFGGTGSNRFLRFISFTKYFYFDGKIAILRNSENMMRASIERYRIETDVDPDVVQLYTLDLFPMLRDTSEILRKKFNSLNGEAPPPPPVPIDPLRYVESEKLEHDDNRFIASEITYLMLGVNL